MGSRANLGAHWKEALAVYANQTGIDLCKHDLARLSECKTVEDVLVALQDEMRTFRAFESHNRNWRDMRAFVRRIASSVLGLCDTAATRSATNVSMLPYLPN